MWRQPTDRHQASQNTPEEGKNLHSRKPQTLLQLQAQNNHTAVAKSTNSSTKKTPYHKPTTHTTTQEQQLKITLKDKPLYSTSEGLVHIFETTVASSEHIMQAMRSHLTLKSKNMA